MSVEDIASWTADGTLRSSDLILHPFRLDWGNGEDYPLDSMLFFESERPDVACKMHTIKYETNQYRPKQCYEWRIRLFVKTAALKNEAAIAFERYMKKLGGLLNSEREEPEVHSALPNKRMRLS